MKKIILSILALTFLGSVSSFAVEKAISIEEFLEQLSTVKGVTDRRDPFEAARPPFENRTESDAPIVNAPPLEKYQVEAYKVVATMATGKWGAPRALIKLPDIEKGKVVTVKLFDHLGNRGGRIIKIDGKGLVVLQNQKSALGFIDKAEIKLFIRADAE